MLLDGIQESEQVSEFNTDVSAEWKNTTWRNIYYKGHHPFIYHCELKRCSEGYFHFYMDQFSSDQLLSHVRLIATPCTAAHQASLSITNSQSLLKLMFIESVMPSHHFILCCPLLLLPSIFPSIRVFSNESALRIRWQKYWSFSFNISPFNEHSRLIFFRLDWLDLLAVHGTLKSLL